MKMNYDVGSVGPQPHALEVKQGRAITTEGPRGEQSEPVHTEEPANYQVASSHREIAASIEQAHKHEQRFNQLTLNSVNSAVNMTIHVINRSTLVVVGGNVDTRRVMNLSVGARTSECSCTSSRHGRSHTV